VKHTVLFFFGIINEGEAHSDDGCLSNTPSLHNLSTSLMMVTFCIFGTGKAGPWYEDKHSFNLKETGFFSSHLKCHQRATHIS
jgi:hypothetical protein